MSNVCFFSLPAHGHVNPSLTLVSELVARGEHVIYYCSDAFAEKVQGTGAHFRSYDHPFLAHFAATPDVAYRLMKAAQVLLDDELARLQEDALDYIIHDATAPWGACIAEALGLPAIASVTTVAFNEHVHTLAEGAGIVPENIMELFAHYQARADASQVRKEIQQTYGIQGPRTTDMFSVYGQLNIVYTSAFFQPFSETFDERFKFVGPVFSGRRETVDFPWDRLDHEVLVYVSPGTSYNRDAAFYQTCFEALNPVDCQMVVSTGAAWAAEALENKPGHSIVRSYVPQLEILQRAAVFITRGGMNSISESLYYGVPVVVIPYMAEQAVNARRVEQLGAGIHLKRKEVTSPTLRAAVQKILTDERYRVNSVKIGDSFREAGGVQKAVDAIFTFREQPW